VQADETRTFYRLLKSSEATADDFKSNAALGLQPRRPLSGLARECWRGISVWETLQQASAVARVHTMAGRYAARLVIPAGAAVRYQRTFRAEGHYTLWTVPATLLSYVVDVLSIDPFEQ
jgi:hypothetical protein